MIEEYTVVRLKRTAPSIPLPAGTEGTVLIAHRSESPAYEVEFLDGAGDSLGVYTVGEADLEEVKVV